MQKERGQIREKEEAKKGRKKGKALIFHRCD